MIKMPFTNKRWDGSASRWDTAKAYCDCCLVNLNEGPSDQWTKGACHLPVREPDGPYNTHGLQAAAGVLLGSRGGVDIPLAEKVKAARKLVRLMREAKMEPGEGILKLAGE